MNFIGPFYDYFINKHGIEVFNEIKDLILSKVIGFKFPNIFKNIDKPAVPVIALKKKCFPFFTNEIINSGIFKTKTVVPRGAFNK